MINSIKVFCLWFRLGREAKSHEKAYVKFLGFSEETILNLPGLKKTVEDMANAIKIYQEKAITFDKMGHYKTADRFLTLRRSVSRLKLLISSWEENQQKII